MVDIRVRTIPHKAQRYNTVGDWTWARDGALSITVSALGNEQYECLVALHEIVEAVLCRAAGVSEDAVTKFDVEWLEKEETRPTACVEVSGASTEPIVAEPGDDPQAPYFHQHKFATLIEMLMAHELGISWATYEKAIAAL